MTQNGGVTKGGSTFAQVGFQQAADLLDRPLEKNVKQNVLARRPQNGQCMAGFNTLPSCNYVNCLKAG